MKELQTKVEAAERVERIARKIEDPETCEWVPGIGMVVGMARPEKSAIGCWRRVQTASGRRHPLPGSEPHLVESWERTAGWLIECLVRAGYEVTVEPFQIMREGDPGYRATVDGEEHIASNMLHAVIGAAERSLGLE